MWCRLLIIAGPPPNRRVLKNPQIELCPHCTVKVIHIIHEKCKDWFFLVHFVESSRKNEESGNRNATLAPDDVGQAVVSRKSMSCSPVCKPRKTVFKILRNFSKACKRNRPSILVSWRNWRKNGTGHIGSWTQQQITCWRALTGK